MSVDSKRNPLLNGVSLSIIILGHSPKSPLGLSQEYSFSNPRGKVGECPKMIVDEDKPFRSGLRFESTDVMDDRWYNWRVQNWGTKWDAYTMEIDDTDMPHGFEVQFETAWSPPEEVCNAIREQFDDLSISWFYDEPGCEIAGYL